MEAIRKKARKMGLYVPKELEFKNRSAAQSGENGSGWRGGKKKTSKGYVQILAKGHPRADRNGYVMEHILVWEEATGSAIPNGFCIHHLNGDKADNRIENLCMMLHSAHTVLHHKGKHLGEEAKQKIAEKARARLSDKTKHPAYKEIDIEAAIAQRKHGVTVDELCRALGISKTTFYRKVGENNS